MFRKLLDAFKGNSHKSDSSSTGLAVIDEKPAFTEEDQQAIVRIASDCKLDFFFINDYAKDLFLKTANIFSDDIVNTQSLVIDRATTKIDEMLGILTTMNKSNFDIAKVKEINLLSHFYKDELYKYIVILNKKQGDGFNYFKDYDIYIEAGNVFIADCEKGIDNSVTDTLQRHLNEETKKNIERFKEKIFKLKTNKLYHSQSLTQISIIHSISEKIYQQINEIIFIVIPVLKTKDSMDLSIEQMNKIKKNLLSIKNDKDKKIREVA